MGRRRFTSEQLVAAVRESRSYRQTIIRLGLVPAGGNYRQLVRYIKESGLDTSHFKGQAWNKGLSILMRGRPIEEVLVLDSWVTSSKLKKRLFRLGLKPKHCEECGWAQQTPDGYLPLELDHINGDPRDNRIENLRVLCPNCHSLKPTHRGRNKKRKNG